MAKGHSLSRAENKLATENYHSSVSSSIPSVSFSAAFFRSEPGACTSAFASPATTEAGRPFDGARSKRIRGDT